MVGTPHTVLGGNRSGAARSQLTITLRFLGLMTNDRQATTDLEELVLKEEPTKTLRRLLEQHYEPAFALGLDNATVAQLDQVLTDMGAGRGETLRKTRQFFLNAATAAGIPIGPFLKRATGSPPSSIRKKSKAKPSSGGAAVTPMDRGDRYSVGLQSGGQVSVTVSVNLFDLSTDDRNFVIDLVDRLKNYPSPATRES